MPRALVWIRDDLRLDDHLALLAALEARPEVALLTVLDPRAWGRAEGLGPVDLPRLGRARAHFWMTSVARLRDAARARGGELLVRVGDPGEVVPRMSAELDAAEVFAQAHVADEETRSERAVARALAASGRRLILTPGRTLIHAEELPFPLAELPDVFTAFRKRVEAEAVMRTPRPAPERLPAPPDAEPGALPDPESLVGADRLDGAPPDPGPALMRFEGGEEAGWAELLAWTFDADALGTYKQTRNGLLRREDSSRLSPWLAAGCLSPRRVAEVVARYEQERGANESTYWLIFELLWRDYFAFLARREGPRLFRQSGVGRRARRWRHDRERFDAWREGRTGYPFVDAFMRELRSTGFMSNRGRQNVASFLAKSLGIDWRWGAAWFEACLVDYDPASNWGNWQYAAGVGTDPRDRVFNVVKQAFDYDPDAEFTKRWVPAVGALPEGTAHTPWTSADVDYPDPLVDPALMTRPPRTGRSRGARGGRKGTRG